MTKIVFIASIMLVAGVRVAWAQPVVTGWRPPAGCVANEVIKFNGTSWVCGSVSSFSTSNVLPKGNGTGLVASRATDDGTTFVITSSPTRLAFDTTHYIDIAAKNNHDASIITSGGNIYFSAYGATNSTSISPVGNFATNSTSTSSVTGTGANAFAVTYVGTAQTTDRVGLTGANTGTFDTTATGRVAYGIAGSCNATRAAGANNVECRGVYATAASATGVIARALVADAGDVLLNATSGTTAIGASPNASIRLLVASPQHGISSTSTASASTSGKIGGQFTSTGTYDTTSGGTTAYGVQGIATGTRSSGANNLNNIGGYFNASGGQVNFAIQADNGGVGLNLSSGTTLIGNHSTNPGQLYMAGTETGDQKRLTFEASDASDRFWFETDLDSIDTNDLLGLRSSTTDNILVAKGSGQVFMGTNNVSGTVQGGTQLLVQKASGDAAITARVSNEDRDVFIGVDDTNDYARMGTTANQPLVLRTNNANRILIASSGAVAIGDTGSGTSIDSDLDVLTIGNSGTGQTADTKLINATHTGTYSLLVEVNRVAYGLYADVNASDSGGGSLRNVAVYAAASNGDENFAAQFAGGDIGYKGGTTIKRFTGSGGLTINTGGSTLTFCSDAGCIASFAGSSTLTVGGSITTNSSLFVAFNANIDGNATLGDTPGSDTHTINGVTTIKGGTPTAAAAMAGSMLIVDQANGTSNAITIRGNTSKWLAFSNASTGLDGGVGYDAGASRALALVSANTTRLMLDSSGTILMGDGSFTAVADNVDVVTVANTGTGQTTTNKAVTRIAHSGSFNTTSAAVTAYGLHVNMTSTRSAGANNLTNRAAFFSASGAQNNIALMTDVGDVILNNNGGTTSIEGALTVNADATIGVESGSNVITLHGKINSHVHTTGTAPAASSCGTAPAVTGNDTAFKVVTGTGATGCTLTFASNYGTAPVCVVSPADNADVFQISVTPTVLTLSSTPAAATYWVHCIGN